MFDKPTISKKNKKIIHMKKQKNVILCIGK